MTDVLAARKELLRRKRSARLAGPTPVIEPASSSSAFSVAEQRMWRIHKLDPESPSHNITLVLTCAGIESAQLVAGLQAALAESEVFGSVIDDNGSNGGPRRRRIDVAGTWLVPGARWVLGVEDPTDQSVDAVAKQLSRKAFDLTRELPIRALVDDGALVLSVHHLAVDDTSWPMLLGSIMAGGWHGELGELAVAGREAVRDPHVGLAAAVAHAKATWAAPDVRFPLSQSLPVTTPEESWLAPLDEAPGAILTQSLDEGELAAFASYATSVGGTTNAGLIVLCALAVTASTGSYDHVMLVPADNRRAGQHPARVGYCGNIIPIRFSFDRAASADQAMRAGVAAIYAAMAHASVDFGPVLTALRNSGGRFPVVEVMGSVRGAPMRDVPVPDGASVDYRSVSHGISPYPLTVAIELDGEHHAQLEIDYQLSAGEVLADRAAASVAGLIRELPTTADLPLESLLAEVSAIGTNQSKGAL